MADTAPPRSAQEEGDHLTIGPGVVATKSQARGAAGGIVLGGVIGALVGALIGVLVFGGALGIIITAVCVGFGGAVFGGTAGGFVNVRGNVSADSPADN